MKNLILILSFLSTNMVLAQQVCAPTSAEMANYFQQESFSSHTVSDGSELAPINGYIDKNNRFFFNDLSRSGDFKAKVTVDPKNKSYAEFFNYCAKGKGRYLRLQRLSGENNRYTVSLRYLPTLKGFSNSPLVDQKYVENNVNVSIKYDDNATISKNDFSEQAKAELQNLIKRQVLSQPEYGLINLDLTGWDDVVCDLVQGHIKISVNRDAISNGPLAQQVQKVDPADLQTIYSQLQQQGVKSSTKEKFIFLAGRTINQLENDRRIGKYGEAKQFDILQKVMTADMSRLADLDGSAIECLSAQMQEYKRPLLQHVMGIKIRFPSLEEIAPKSELNE